MGFGVTSTKSQNRRNPRQGIETGSRLGEEDASVRVRIDEIPVRGLKLLFNPNPYITTLVSQNRRNPRQGIETDILLAYNDGPSQRQNRRNPRQGIETIRP